MITLGKMQVTSLFLLLGTFSIISCRVAVLKPGEYEIEWEVKEENITVTATVKTLGYVGLGISPGGDMTGADLILSGRYSNGTGYISDASAFANTGPDRDASQDVTLLTANENSTHTTVTFTRKLDTGDIDDDLVILNETQFIIWSYGPTDTPFYYHGPNRGTVSLNFLQP